MTLAALVHASVPGLAQVPSGPAQASQGRSQAAATGLAGEGLPRPVAEMREAILDAVQSGRLEDLRHAIELNEMKPLIGESATGDPIEALAALAGDGDPGGQGLLKAIGAILAARWIAVRRGPDLENNRVFIWPKYAETGVRELTPEEQAELAAIVPPDMLQRMREDGKYDYWRLAVGADGTWHYLRK